MARRSRARPAPRPARLPRVPRVRGRRWLWRARGVGLVAVALSGVWGLRQADVFYPVEQPYSRGLYAHWIDADGDCQDTRHEVLIRDSTARVRLTADGCRVVGGRWNDPYSGRVITDPSGLDVDHLVPLAEAHRSGADAWSADRRRAFANDLSSPLTLLPVRASANRSKADRDPLAWMPRDPTRWCAYTRAWMAVKTRWGLDRDLLERWWTDGVLWVCRMVG